MSIYPLQTQLQTFGTLQVTVRSVLNNLPIENAMVGIYNTNDMKTKWDELKTDQQGNTTVIRLPAPPVEYSFEPTGYLPYSNYIITVEFPGFQSVQIIGTQIYPGIMSIQPVRMYPYSGLLYQTIIIGPNTLNGDYSPNVPEESIKSQYETGSPVIIPQDIVVHTNVPSDNTAWNFIDRYIDYVNNVVANEIYPTWPAETINANILAIMSFTLNRVYTKWYPRQGYNFDITSRNPFDNQWFYGRNYFQNISAMINQSYNKYISLPGIIQPILTQICNGRLVYCKAMMEKWISKDLGIQGYSSLEILQHFYGSSIYINSTDRIMK